MRYHLVKTGRRISEEGLSSVHDAWCGILIGGGVGERQCWQMRSARVARMLIQV